MKIFLLLIFYISVILAGKIYAQCPPGQNPIGPELIVNGDFEQGNTGFTSGYFYCNTSQCVGEGDYGVHSNPSFLHQDFVGSDHTTGTGSFMMINGAVTPGVSVWCQTVNVTPNTTYLLSAWVITIAGSYAPAELEFTINGVPIGNIFDAPDTFFVWDQFTATWNSGSNTSADICIEAVSTHFGGNDFGLDDISFIPCQCNINASASPNANICEGDIIQLHSSGGNNYLWQPPTGLSNPNIADPLAFPDTTTTYSVIISNGLGCSDTLLVTITVDEPFINAGPDTTICEGQSVNLFVIPDSGTYIWSPATGLNNSNAQNPVASPTNTTIYSVIVTTNAGCVDTSTVTVFVELLPVFDAGPDTSINKGDTIVIDLQNNNSINWIPSLGISCDTCSILTAFPHETTTYIITATSPAGCVATDTLTIYVNENPPPPPPDDKHLFIPNIFTPDNDGFNDNYEIIIRGYESAFLSIYNRWGQLLFETNELPPIWNGKVKGKDASEGVYFYILTLNGESEKYNGFLHLVK